MRRGIITASATAMLVFGLTVAQTSTASAAPAGRTLVNRGTVNLAGLGAAPAGDYARLQEVNPGTPSEGQLPPGKPGKKVDASPVSSTPGAELIRSFQGLNHRDQRRADGGNQFSSEPPDQGLCANDRYVVEVINSAVQVYGTSGNKVGSTVSLNKFFGYPSAFVRPNGPFGPNLFDIACYFDSDTGRFIVMTDGLGQDATTGALTGKGWIDLAVSTSSDPTGSWTRFNLPTQDDGTDGTPNHKCDDGAGGFGPCFGDYPHIGADAYGIYLTTNEYSLLGSNYNGAQIYAISKHALVAGSAAPRVISFEGPALGRFHSFTVWPAIAPAGKDDRSHAGTEWLLSSTLGDGSETGNTAPTEKRIGLWALTNTSSLDSASPAVSLANALIEGDTYALPPQSTQKDGLAPLRDCINDTTTPTPFGPGCWNWLFDTEPGHNEKLTTMDSGDTRMQQVVYSDGMLWGSMGTAVKVQGADGSDHVRAGVLWLAVRPHWEQSRLTGETARHGYIAVADGDVTYPALAISPSGNVAIGMTLTGDHRYPSAAYAVISGEHATIKVAAAGQGPDDGFTPYVAFGYERPRWGDYGAAAMVGNTLWFANEYIAAPGCSVSDFIATGFSCGGTRTTLANFSTRITAIKL